MFLTNWKKSNSLKNYFEDAPDFIEVDNRRFRPSNPSTIEQLGKRHRAMFSEEFVKDKSILDLGCCLGATGHWVLAAGAKSYLGVEVQKEYVELGNPLLQKYHGDKGKIIQADVEQFLKNNKEKFDIVCVLGVLYVFVDYFSILKLICDSAKENVVIDHMYPDFSIYPESSVMVQLVERQSINLANQNGSLIGYGSRISPEGLKFLMKFLGFGDSKRVFPEKILNSPDIYDVEERILNQKDARYIIIFDRSKKEDIKTLSEDLSGEKNGEKKSWD